MSHEVERRVLRSNAWIAVRIDDRLMIRPWSPHFLVIVIPVAALITGLVYMAIKGTLSWPFSGFGIAISLITGISFLFILSNRSTPDCLLIVDLGSKVLQLPNQRLICPIDEIIQWRAVKRGSPTGRAVDVMVVVESGKGGTSEYVILTDVAYSVPIKLVKLLAEATNKPYVVFE